MFLVSKGNLFYVYFHTPIEWKIGFKVINKQTIVQILIVNTAFYIYGNMRLKEISILNSFEQIQENTIAGSAFSAQFGRGFHTRPFVIQKVIQGIAGEPENIKKLHRSNQLLTEVSRKAHAENLLRAQTFHDLKVRVYPHR